MTATATTAMAMKATETTMKATMGANEGDEDEDEGNEVQRGKTVCTGLVIGDTGTRLLSKVYAILSFSSLTSSVCNTSATQLGLSFSKGFAFEGFVPRDSSAPRAHPQGSCLWELDSLWLAFFWDPFFLTLV
ncbi:hypothetical protein Nepgr_013257 [Nepenthes gracilis]|uniref:Uncharacterized protein n=1 Tax=Nepenthes gracilis TaxID=150966 RepID=A0AAD3XP46_NEPGR|nr:hypothetical protein Nepgr_013257 [Nepenthes gracilis]